MRHPLASKARRLLPALLFIAAAATAGDGYNPLAAARAEGLIGNVEAGVPPQCYTRTGAVIERRFLDWRS